MNWKHLLLALVIGLNTSSVSKAQHAVTGVLSLPQAAQLTEAPNDEPLTAEEVALEDWTMDENGACDVRRGCPYKNAQGFTRYLPLTEKKKLEKLLEEVIELKTVKAYESTFGAGKNQKKKALIFVFSAEDCGPCQALKPKLQEKKKEMPEVEIFTLTRPSFASFDGHPVHEKLQGEIGTGVPLANIYTKDDNGKWVGRLYRGGNTILQEIQKFEEKATTLP